MTNIVWLRHELRVSDNPALHCASQENAPVLPVYIWQPDAAEPFMPGSASRWWLHHSLTALAERLTALGSPLLLRTGAPETVLPQLARSCKANTVFWSRAYDPAGREEDDRVIEALQADTVRFRTFAASNHFITPDTLLNTSDAPYKVFTPFWKRAVTMPVSAPLPVPTRLNPPVKAPDGVSVSALNLLPKHDWTAGLRRQWTPGETGAQTRLQHFLDHDLENYGDARDYPERPGVSRLSPHLHFGEISPRTLHDAINHASDGYTQKKHMAGVFLRQIYWREFGMYLLYHFPAMTDTPMRPEFTRFPWRNDKRQLRLWQQGLTGYPLVDAGMRELWHTGWMHNRVRMVAASFLVKHLLLPWQAGAAWFWDTLVDADIANNTLGWQWVSGCGPDAAPYFRIFNPVTQGRRYDGNGAYVRRWIPELSRLDDKHLHAPWQAPEEVLRAAGIVLGEAYPLPIVEHKAARQRALDAFAHARAR